MLRRHREARGLSQREAAEGSGVSQSALARVERGQPVDEEALVVLERFLGVRDAYPSAPKDPVRRLAWFAVRAGWRVSAPPSGVFGAGKVPAER
jgi:transcriptional regulator with XRE-family HTH domain